MNLSSVKCKETATTNWTAQKKKAFIIYITGNKLQNFKTKINKINSGQIILGTPKPIIQGNMTREPPLTYITGKRLPLPFSIAKHHINLHLYMGFFFVNGIPILHTKSVKKTLMSVQYCNRK